MASTFNSNTLSNLICPLYLFCTLFFKLKSDYFLCNCCAHCKVNENSQNENKFWNKFILKLRIDASGVHRGWTKQLLRKLWRTFSSNKYLRKHWESLSSSLFTMFIWATLSTARQFNQLVLEMVIILWLLEIFFWEVIQNT